jgi:TDG/mug DNA glycosylase family protein
MNEAANFPQTRESLPDLIRAGLDVLFIGINPSLFSVAKGHYFARPANRFWPAFSRSFLSFAARQALGVEALLASHDSALLEHGFGFTDAVKRATARATDLSHQEFSDGIADLSEKLKVFQPKIACFHGIMAYRPIYRALTGSRQDPKLGLQTLEIGKTKVFLCPNPSPANAHFTPADQTRSYDELAAYLATI